MLIIEQVKVILFQSQKVMLATREKVCKKCCAKHKVKSTTNKCGYN